MSDKPGNECSAQCWITEKRDKCCCNCGKHRMNANGDYECLAFAEPKPWPSHGYCQQWRKP